MDVQQPQSSPQTGTHGNRATPIPISNRKRPTLAKFATAGDNFLKYIGESYFNPFKEAIVDSSYHTVTLEIEHILAGKRTSLPPQKSTRANPQKKTTSRKMTGGYPTLIQTTTISSFRIPLRNRLETAVFLNHHPSDLL